MLKASLYIELNPLRDRPFVALCLSDRKIAAHHSHILWETTHDMTPVEPPRESSSRDKKDYRTCEHDPPPHPRTPAPPASACGP